VNPILWELDEHAVIRTFTPDDADELFELVEANRDRLEPWMPWAPVTTSTADVRGFIERSLASQDDLEGNGIWVDGRVAGAMGMSVITLNDSGSIGYWIAREHEGKGIVTRGARRFAEFGFEELGLHRISISAAVENARSRAVAERLGFRQEAILRGADKTSSGYLDMVVYAMLRQEWPQSATA
jgi:ribosomal-protein-serine acetyltransferase